RSFNALSRTSSSAASRRYLARSATIARFRSTSRWSAVSWARSCETWASAGARRRKYPAAAMMISPATPATSFCGRGALTIGSKNGGSAISALVPAGDFERHQRCRPGQVPAGDHQIDLLELAGRTEVRHEVRDRGGRERRARDLELQTLLLEPGDPEIVRQDARERVGEQDRQSLVLDALVDDIDQATQ